MQAHGCRGPYAPGVRRLPDRAFGPTSPGSHVDTPPSWALQVGPADIEQLERAKEATIALVEQLDKLGVLETIRNDWDERYSRRFVESLRALTEQGGVLRLRRELLAYLKDRMEEERLRAKYRLQPSGWF